MIRHLIRALKREKDLSSLPLVRVESAAVTDDDTELWGDYRYMNELVSDLLAMARVTANSEACPLLEDMLGRDGLECEDDYVIHRHILDLDPVGVELERWRMQLNSERHLAKWWLQEQAVA